MIWMVRQVLRGFATLGDLTLFYQAFNQGQSAMRSLLSNVGQLYINSLFLQHFFEFLALEPMIKDPSRPLPPPITVEDGITFSDITFNYPGSERPALNKFNLFVPAGKVTAIVGSNGAGKSTAIKILCRLYDPLSGLVKIDGTDIQAFTVTEIQKQITILFQEPVHYQDTVINNIALSSTNGRVNLDAVQSAARDAGVEDIIDRLPEGFENQLGNWFEGGTELSTGEWQRIALARAFLRKAPIIVLDEPTSNMDPWAEVAWLKRFQELARGRTAIIITHRFTTASCADIIHVMDRGRIVESGTHTDLMTQNNRYAASWREQTNRQSSLSPIPHI